MVDALAANPLNVVVVLALLSLLPFLFVMLTSYVKIAVVLSILRSAVGTPQIPPTIVINGLAIILTLYVMSPTGTRIYDAIKDKLPKSSADAERISVLQLLATAERGKEPLRQFLVKNSYEQDRVLFRELATEMRTKKRAAQVRSDDFLVVVPAFSISQLSSAFQIGFLIFVPFLVIDMVVANVLLALGMHMLSPTTISLPFKLLLFVMVDGWHLLARGLVFSYTG